MDDGIRENGTKGMIPLPGMPARKNANLFLETPKVSSGISTI